MIGLDYAQFNAKIAVPIIKRLAAVIKSVERVLSVLQLANARINDANVIEALVPDVDAK